MESPLSLQKIFSLDWSIWRTLSKRMKSLQPANKELFFSIPFRHCFLLAIKSTIKLVSIYGINKWLTQTRYQSLPPQEILPSTLLFVVSSSTIEKSSKNYFTQKHVTRFSQSLLKTLKNLARVISTLTSTLILSFLTNSKTSLRAIHSFLSS